MKEEEKGRDVFVKRSMQVFVFSVAASVSALTAVVRGGEFTSNGIAIRVNNQTVSIREVEMIFADSYGLIQDKLKSGDLNERSLNAAIRVAWDEAMNTAAQDRLIDQRADQRRRDIIRMYVERGGPQMGAERAKEYFKREEAEYLRRLRKELVNAAGGEEELRAALKRRGQTLREWEDGLSRELFRRDVMALELGPIQRSPMAVRNFYEKNPELFRQPEAWRLKRIRIAKSKFSSAEKALEAANLVKAKIESGSDFGEIASRISDDPQYASQGGLLTRNERSDLPSGAFPGEEKIASALEDGQISAPVDAGDWYVLVQRIGYRKAVQQPFEEAAERAEALMYADKLRERKREVFEKLKRESYVEFVQKDPPAHLLKPDNALEFVDPSKGR